jgi:hypothetical protein
MPDIYLGCDIARFGDDLSVVAIREANRIYELVVMQKLDNVDVSGEIQELARQYKPRYINVDSIGLGSGVVDILRSNGLPVNGVNVAEPSKVEDDKGNKLYANLRAELWWTVREQLNPKNPEPLLLPMDDELLADLAAPIFRYNARGQIQIEPKEDTKKRLKRSPDRADAVILTFAIPVEEPPYILEEGEMVVGSEY